MNQEEKEQKYDKKFNGLNLNNLELLPGEQIKRCIDTSQDGKFYFSEWIATNKGRVWSLAQNKWITPCAMGDQKAYWGYCSVKKTIKAHSLFCHYFMDKSDRIALKHFGADGVDVHHIIAINIPEELKVGTDDNREARIEHCKKCNQKSNLCYQESIIIGLDHVVVNQLAQGREHKSISLDEQLASFNQMAVNSGKREGNSNGVRIVYSEDEYGNLKRTLITRMTVKGSLC